MFRSVFFFWLATVCMQRALADDAPPVRLLLLGDAAGHHRSEELARSISPALKPFGVEVEFTRDIHDLNAKKLAGYDCLAIYGDSGDLPTNEEAALVDFVEQGRGLVAIHCASHIFRNSQRYTELIGGRFDRHGEGVFRAHVIDAQHPAMRSVVGFESFDETYLHNQTSNDRRVLMVRPHEGGYEPWTWVRQQGKGRVYYTASGHDERTWRQPGFVRLIASGVQWAAGRTHDEAPALKFAKSETGLPNYTPGQKWGVQGEPINEIQEPLSAADSIKHMHLPEGMHVELFAAEPDVVKPLAMTFDARGRLWVSESVDYPNDGLKSTAAEGGRDRVKICEDTDGDGRADKFTIFAENLAIPTGLCLVKDGLLVSQAPHMLLLRDADGDDRADERRVLFTGFGLKDTHAGPSNLHYGPDGWVYGCVGYSGFDGEAGGARQKFSQGLFRFRPDGSAFEFLTSTSNNTWGLAIGEDGELFGSTANNEHGVHMALPNQVFESVRGFHASGGAGIVDHRRFHPVTDNVRQVDVFGGFTAAAGHEFISSSRFPALYHNAAMVCEPTGHLIHLNLVAPQGSGYVAHDGYNLLASTDAWTSPIAAQVGPDCAVWVLDWYNIIVQHNPTPHGFETGRGNAYVTPLRDKKHGRIYRIVSDLPPKDTQSAALGRGIDLAKEDVQAVALALSSGTMNERLTAERILVERQDKSVAPLLAGVVSEKQGEPGAMHALYALELLGALEGSAGDELISKLDHPGVPLRRALADIVPRLGLWERSPWRSKLLTDNHPAVRLRLLWSLALAPQSTATPEELWTLAQDPMLTGDRWLPLALAAAAARIGEGFLGHALAQSQTEATAEQRQVTRAVAEHLARGPTTGLKTVLAAAGKNPESKLLGPTIEGLLAGLPATPSVKESVAWNAALTALLKDAPGESKSAVLALATRLGVIQNFAAEVAAMRKALMAVALGLETTDSARREAIASLAGLGLDLATTQELLASLGPKTSSDQATALLEAVGRSALPETGDLLIQRFADATPAVRKLIVTTLLRRPEWSGSLLSAIEDRRLSPDDLALEQQQQLTLHPDKALQARAAKILSTTGPLPSPDRKQVLDTFMPLAAQTGKSALGRVVFEKNCAKCHRHGDLGAPIGPELTGIGSRKKPEILVDVLDPNRSVEGNFQQYTVLTNDGRVMSGLLKAETKTAIELLDAEGKKQIVLRDDVDELSTSRKSLMPEGFEKLPPADLVDLLEFLVDRGAYRPVSLADVATIATDRGMFYNEDSEIERLVFPDWKTKVFAGVPFDFVDPANGRHKNAILLYGPQGSTAPRMPKSVTLPIGGPVKTLHLLSGVSGWGFPLAPSASTSMIVRWHYQDGKAEDAPLVNGEHFADYIRRIDVPGSQFAFDLNGRQIRYLTVRPKRTAHVESVELVKGEDDTAPVVMAATVELPSQTTIEASSK